jgi:UDP-glucose 4-epimerase
MENIFPKLVAASLNSSDHFPVFGNDYLTRDGTCIRDYVHVMDLASAHVKALQFLIAGQSQAKVESFNIGSGAGVTVLEAIAAMQKATGRAISVVHQARRPGDIPAIYADTSKAASVLGWSPKYTLLDICKSSYAWGEKLKELRTESDA